MNYLDGQEVQLRDYIYRADGTIGGGRVMEIAENRALVKMWSGDTLWLNAAAMLFNQHGAPAPTGICKTFFVHKWGWEVLIRMDTSLIPDDSFRETFYDMHTLKEMARHFVWNRYKQGFKGQVEGLFEEQCEAPYTWVLYAEKVK